jgi:hypothetical protein
MKTGILRTIANILIIRFGFDYVFKSFETNEALIGIMGLLLMMFFLFGINNTKHKKPKNKKTVIRVHEL